MKKYILKYLKAAMMTLALLILFLSVFIMLGSIFKNEKQLAPWGTGFFLITTNSMNPEIPEGSIVFVISVPDEKIQPDDIITYFASNGETVITHRVRQLNGEESIITRGDANNEDDSPVDYERVIGRVAFSLAVPGLFSNNIQTVMIIGFNILGIGLVLCVSSVISERKKKKNQIPNISSTEDNQ